MTSLPNYQIRFLMENKELWMLMAAPLLMCYPCFVQDVWMSGLRPPYLYTLREGLIRLIH